MSLPQCSGPCIIGWRSPLLTTFLFRSFSCSHHYSNICIFSVAIINYRHYTLSILKDKYLARFPNLTATSQGVTVNYCHSHYLGNFCNFINLFIYLFLAVLGLRFCARAFSSCSEWGPLFIAVHGPLTVTASPVAQHRLQTRGLSSCGSRA